MTIPFLEAFEIVNVMREGERRPRGFVRIYSKLLVEALPYEVPFEFTPSPEHYSKLVYQIYLENFDTVVGDISITAARLKYVHFTIPYTDLGVGTIARVKTNKKDMWIFAKPIGLDLCLMMAVFFIFTGIVIWVIEKPKNKEFQGSADWNNLLFNSIFQQCRAIHVSAIHQTKWWFAKRFLHPDVVSEYAYIFLWDEDLGPGLDPDKSEVHHRITEREKGSKVHRRIYKRSISGKMCYFNSTDPPCTGWVEMMAPVFSRASWHCVWHMIQICSLVTVPRVIGPKIFEYVVHQGLPTLGGSAENKAASAPVQPNIRDAVRSQSIVELEIFKNRWRNAVRKDECWVDPLQPVKHNS
ncbi:hypothetical protein POM88_047256 [Heracleum sosnowskyi]|uniref:Solute-binding protein family 3/N-terminal domain-containing protein n=1 Tax=Heracleum sosnowskyi TaxID=360622 RepID=A0AAD8LXD3_9APIA|nr:hypothetical protein POM88_047256 [Heracleum sosnowskyi]